MYELRISSIISVITLQSKVSFFIKIQNKESRIFICFDFNQEPIERVR